MSVPSLTTVLLLAACAAGCAHPEVAAAHADPYDEPVRGGALRMVLEAPSTLDPLGADSLYEAVPVLQLFDGLVALDPSLRVVPRIAKSWRIGDGGREYVFDLRDDVRFHDGTRLTAGDVAFTLRRALAPGGRRSLAFPYLNVIDGAGAFSAGRSDVLRGVTALGPHRIRIALTRDYPAFLEVLTMDALRIVPRHAFEQGTEAFGRAPLGSGPFRFACWSDGELRLEAFDDYFAGAPHLDALVFEARDSHLEESVYAQRFLDGDFEIHPVGATQLARFRSTPGIHVQQFQELGLAFVGLSNSAPPLDDPLVRRAIAHAVDREALTRHSPETRREATGLLPPGMRGYSPARKALAHDPGQARRLLARAGYPGGEGLPAVELLMTRGGGSTERLVDGLQADLRAVGIELRRVPVDWAELSRRIDERSAPMFMLGWIADLTDPDAYIRTLFASGGDHNYFGYADAETDRLLDRAVLEPNPELRAALYQRIERRILAEAPIVPLFHTVGVLASRGNVRGLEAGPLGLANVSFKQVWLQRPGSEHDG